MVGCVAEEKNEIKNIYKSMDLYKEKRMVWWEDVRERNNQTKRKTEKHMVGGKGFSWKGSEGG